MLRVYLTIVGMLLLSGCTSWKYKVEDEVKFEIRSWNHDPIIKAVEDADPEINGVSVLDRHIIGQRSMTLTPLIPIIGQRSMTLTPLILTLTPLIRMTLTPLIRASIKGWANLSKRSRRD